MRATRWPALVLIPLLLAAMLVAGRDTAHDQPAGSATTVVEADPGRAPAPLSLAADDAATADDWYCPVGTGGGGFGVVEPPEESPAASTDDGVDESDEGDGTDGGTDQDEADQDEAAEIAVPQARDAVIDRSVLVVTNTADSARVATVSLYGPDGPIGTHDLDVAAHTRTQFGLRSLTDVDVVAALVELDGGGVGVAQLSEGPQGPTLSPCVGEPAGSWFIPAAATRLDARAILTLFNPFPDDAILEISFVDDEEVRVPGGFEAFPVPAESVVAVDLTDIVTVRPQFSTAVRARAGQVVIAMVQTYDGSEGPEGLAVVPGAPVPSRTWYFPTGRWDDRQSETYVLFNPGERDAQVDVAVALDDPATNGAVQPFEVTVPRFGFVAIGSNQDEWARVPEGVAHSVTVRVRNDAPIVAEQRFLTVGGDRPGLAQAMGSPVAATDWIVSIVDLDATASSITVVNPSPLSLTQVDVTAVSGGEEHALDPVEVAQGTRTVLDVLDGTGMSVAGARVGASHPVVVSSGYSFDRGGRAWMVAVPVAGTAVDPATLEEARPDTGVPVDVEGDGGS